MKAYTTRRLWSAQRVLALSASVLVAASCGGESPPQASAPPAADAAVTPPPQPLPAVRLVVDADRNGVLDDNRAEWTHRASWSTTHGAMLMANVDDDDGNHRVDALDEAVNGEGDEADLARIRIAAIPDAPAGAEASLTLDAQSAPMVRLFKRGADGWTVFRPEGDRVSRDELVAGVEFGIEAKDFPTSTWTGRVEITLTVHGESERTDRAEMHTAPWLMHSSINPTVRVWGPQAEGYGPADAFTYDIEDYTSRDGMPLTLVNTLNPAYHPDPMEGPDVWVQDIMEIGWTGIPAAGGMHSMPVVLRTPNNQRPLARYADAEMLGPDFGYVVKRATAAANGRSWYPSLDSFGDLELLPPFRHGDQDFPLGRIIHGSIPTHSSDRALRAFLEAQGVQGPPLYVDTSWLHVGHVDEFMSFVPADTPRGWKLLWASPTLARRTLQGFMGASPRNRDVTMFTGKYWFYSSGPMRGRPYSAQRTVGQILGDADLMAYNQEVQGHLDTIREQVQEATGLTDDEIVEIPILFWEQENRMAAAYMPGTVNLLLYNHTAIMARPYGPLVGERDIIEDDMTERLRPFGITVRFAEQWDILHAGEGEVHCGTNALREVPAQRWWEVAR